MEHDSCPCVRVGGDESRWRAGRRRCRRLVAWNASCWRPWGPSMRRTDGSASAIAGRSGASGARGVVAVLRWGKAAPGHGEARRPPGPRGPPAARYRGLVERFAGRGSFVVERVRRPAQWTIGAGPVPARRFAHVAQLLGAPDTVFHVQAVRSSGEGPSACSTVGFRRGIARTRVYPAPLILLVEKHCGLPPYRARQVALAAPADRAGARHLRVAFGDRVPVLERTYFPLDDRPIEHTRIQYRSDRCQQVVNLSRRPAPPCLPPPAAEVRSPRGYPHGPIR